MRRVVHDRSQAGIDDNLTDVGNEIDMRLSGTKMTVEVENVTGGSTLDKFVIYAKDHPDGEWYSLLEDSDFTTLVGSLLLPRCTTLKPNTLAAGTLAHFELWVTCWGLKFAARSSAASPTCTVNVKLSIVTEI